MSSITTKGKRGKANDDEHELLINKRREPYGNHLEQQRRLSPFSSDSLFFIRWFTNLFWCWAIPLLAQKNKEIFDDDDLVDLPDCDRSANLRNKVRAHDWKETITRRAILEIFWKDILRLTLPLLLYSIIRLAQPMILYKMVEYLKHDQLISAPTSSMGYAYATALSICMLAQPFIFQQITFISGRVGVAVRNTLMLSIYEQLLSAKSGSLSDITNSRLIDLISNDLTKFDDSILLLNYIWQAPLELIVVLFILSWIVGFLPTLCSGLMFVLLIPLQVFFRRKFSQYREEIITSREKRISAFSELIDGCYVIKAYCWEKAIRERLYQLRQCEYTSLWRAYRLRALNMGIFFASLSLLGLLMLGSAWLLNISLKSTDIFIVLAFYGKIRTSATLFLPMGIEKMSELIVILKRVDLMMQHLTADLQTITFLPNTPSHDQNTIIVMRQASFSWLPNRICLSSLNLTIRRGSYIGIIGPTGSGKSSLLAAILGEMKLADGVACINAESFSYSAQSAWIINDTIRANVLVGNCFQENHYRSILRACTLDVDLQGFGPSGDLTTLSDRGVSVSGGQRSRIALARALYKDAEIYLLDDPFASVDYNVAKQIHERCFSSRGLLRNKTRLLVTHQPEFLADCDQIFFMDDGYLSICHGLDEIPVDFYHHGLKDITLTDQEEQNEQPNTNTMSREKWRKDEEVTCDPTNWSIWRFLFLSLSPNRMVLLLLGILLIISQILYDGTNYWLRQFPKGSNVRQERFAIFYIYLALTMLTLIVAIFRALYFFHLILKQSNSMHDRMISSLLSTNLSFFTNNSKGRLINRGTRDQQIVDEMLPVTAFDAIQTLLIIFGSVILISILIPWLWLVLISLFPGTWMLRRAYRKSGYQLKRLESASRSPIYGLFTTSFDGLMSIHAFKVSHEFLEMLCSKIDANTRAYINYMGVTQWFSLYLDLMMVFFSCCTTFLTILLHEKLDETTLALSLMYAISLSGWFPHGVRQLNEAENLLVSVERIDEYASLPSEEQHDTCSDPSSLVADWPSHGAIQFRNYSLRYRSNGERSLKHIHFDVDANEKVGIIGRTGAGKSSLFQGILRFSETFCVEGDIFIDGMNISHIPLQYLRSCLSWIPQQPFIFNETLRFNLDPANQYTDEACWIALDSVQLKELVLRHSSGLLLPVADFGSNFSSGQRQLICIARALLRKSRILLIDEATANVDQNTDTILQAILTSQNRDCTILTIAHRLDTVISSDRLLLMSQGRIVAFDTPQKVLSQYQL